MFSIRSQIAIGVISSVLLTTIILVIAYKLMWFNGHMTLTLSITTMITSCLTLSICSIFINPLIQKIKQFNIKTKQFVNGEHLIDDDTFLRLASKFSVSVVRIEDELKFDCF